MNLRLSKLQEQTTLVILLLFLFNCYFPIIRTI